MPVCFTSSRTGVPALRDQRATLVMFVLNINHLAVVALSHGEDAVAQFDPIVLFDSAPVTSL